MNQNKIIAKTRLSIPKFNFSYLTLLLADITH